MPVLVLLEGSDSVLNNSCSFRLVSRLVRQRTTGSEERLENKADFDLLASLLHAGERLGDNLLDVVRAHGFHLGTVFLQDCHLLLLKLLKLWAVLNLELLNGILGGSNTFPNQRQELDIGLNGRGGLRGVVGFGNQSPDDVQPEKRALVRVINQVLSQSVGRIRQTEEYPWLS